MQNCLVRPSASLPPQQCSLLHINKPATPPAYLLSFSYEATGISVTSLHLNCSWCLLLPRALLRKRGFTWRTLMHWKHRAKCLLSQGSPGLSRGPLGPATSPLPDGFSPLPITPQGCWLASFHLPTSFRDVWHGNSVLACFQVFKHI